MKPVDRSPARLGQWASAGAGLVVIASTGLHSWPALVVEGFGLLVLVAGLLRGARAPVSVGAFGLFAGAILAGAGGAPVLPVLVGVTFAVLAWDVGGSAVGIGAQLGRDADTVRLEAVRVAASLVVGTVSAGVGYGLYLTATGGQPIAALVFLALAAVLLVEALS